MQHRIDPKVDCVFKAILGAEENRNLLVHFLNAMLAEELTAPIVQVAVLNPYNERETLDDKLSIVDVKALDTRDRLYQVEIQVAVYSDLVLRMLYTWCDLYSQQLAAGQDDSELGATYSIWLLGGRLFEDTRYARDFKPRDREGQCLVEQGGIWVFELAKFAPGAIANERERWLRFFKDGEGLDDASLPDWMQTEEMRQAMATVRQFSEKERAYHAYQARQNYLRQQRTIQLELERERRAKEQAQRENERAQREKQQACADLDRERRENAQALQEKEAEIERLKAMMKQRSSR